MARAAGVRMFAGTKKSTTADQAAGRNSRQACSSAANQSGIIVSE